MLFETYHPRKTHISRDPPIQFPHSTRISPPPTMVHLVPLRINLPLHPRPHNATLSHHPPIRLVRARLGRQGGIIQCSNNGMVGRSPGRVSGNDGKICYSEKNVSDDTGGGREDR